MNPYDTLGVSPEADDGTVRSAYLEAIKRFPPERYPERFTAISEAYQALKDEKSRMHYELFEMKPGVASPGEAMLSHFAWSERRTPPDFESLKRKLKECASR
jgi:curved DNA-binding protein CbpA